MVVSTFARMSWIQILFFLQCRASPVTLAVNLFLLPLRLSGSVPPLVSCRWQWPCVCHFKMYMCVVSSSLLLFHKNIGCTWPGSRWERPFSHRRCRRMRMMMTIGLRPKAMASSPFPTQVCPQSALWVGISSVRRSASIWSILKFVGSFLFICAIRRRIIMSSDTHALEQTWTKS